METIIAKSIFSPVTINHLELANRIVMAPMTRSRAINNIPNALMAEYYAQRATAGLIITEGTSPSPNGLGYARIPGIFSKEQTQGWKLVTEAVHQKGGKIFIQFMHCGRVGHPLNLPEGAEILAPSAVAAKGEMWTDTQNMQPQPTPRAMTLEEVKSTIQEFISAAKNAIEAGFDGVELHGANGYLIEQFINPVSNTRNDEYGGSIENRAKFVLEIAKGVSDAIGKDKVGIRFSPFNVFNDMAPYNEVKATYDYLSKELNEIGILYIHTVDFGGLQSPEGKDLLVTLRNNFKNTIIHNGGYDKQRAEEEIDNNSANLISFGVPFIANPDFVERLKSDFPLSTPDQNLFYTPGEKGFTDYEFIKK